MRLHRPMAVLLICLAWPAMGGTRIQDTVYYAANGEPAQGQVTISWPSFKSGSRTVVASRMVFQLTAGALSVDLEPNDAGIPAGTSYAVSYQLKAGVRSAECWVVPTSAAPVTIAAIRVAVIPTPAVTVSLTQLLQGGASVGQCVMWNGAAYAPAVCGTVTSVFGRTAAVSATAGDYAASAITNTPAGNIAAVTVQAAIDELDGEKAATGHGHAASAITNTPAGNIAAVTVQAAIDELDGEKAAITHTHAIGDTTGLQTALDGKQTIMSAITGGIVWPWGFRAASGTYASSAPGGYSYVMYFEFPIPYPGMVVSKISGNTTATGDAGAMAFGIYDSGCNLIDGTNTIAGTGVATIRTWTFSPARTLAAGRYFLAYTSDSYAMAFYGGYSSYIGGIGDSGGSGTGLHYFTGSNVSTTVGGITTFPATCGTRQGAGATPPALAVRGDL